MPKQHLTAGPYSPVLEVDAARIVVISGQVAIDAQGNVMGNDIEEQTRYTLANCQRQLEVGRLQFLRRVQSERLSCPTSTEWARFNAVYSEAMPRSAAGADYHRRGAAAGFPCRNRNVGGETCMIWQELTSRDFARSRSPHARAAAGGRRRAAWPAPAAGDRSHDRRAFCRRARIRGLGRACWCCPACRSAARTTTWNFPAA